MSDERTRVCVPRSDPHADAIMALDNLRRALRRLHYSGGGSFTTAATVHDRHLRLVERTIRNHEQAVRAPTPESEAS